MTNSVSHKSNAWRTETPDHKFYLYIDRDHYVTGLERFYFDADQSDMPVLDRTGWCDPDHEGLTRTEVDHLEYISIFEAFTDYDYDSQGGEQHYFADLDKEDRIIRVGIYVWHHKPQPVIVAFDLSVIVSVLDQPRRISIDRFTFLNEAVRMFSYKSNREG